MTPFPFIDWREAPGGSIRAFNKVSRVRIRVRAYVRPMNIYIYVYV